MSFIQGKRRLSARDDHCNNLHTFLSLCRTTTYVIKLTLNKAIIFNFAIFPPSNATKFIGHLLSETILLSQFQALSLKTPAR